MIGWLMGGGGISWDFPGVFLLAQRANGRGGLFRVELLWDGLALCGYGKRVLCACVVTVGVVCLCLTEGEDSKQASSGGKPQGTDEEVRHDKPGCSGVIGGGREYPGENSLAAGPLKMSQLFFLTLYHLVSGPPALTVQFFILLSWYADGWGERTGWDEVGDEGLEEKGSNQRKLNPVHANNEEGRRKGFDFHGVYRPQRERI